MSTPEQQNDAGQKAPNTSNTQLTQRAGVKTPQNQSVGARDASVAGQTNTTLRAQAGKPDQATVIKTSDKKDEPIPDTQLPEVIAAMKIGKPETQSALKQFIDYCDEMHPGKGQTVATIEQSQTKLIHTLYTLLAAEDKNFRVVYQAVLAVVRRHRNLAFKPTNRNRGLNTVQIATIDNRSMRFLTRFIDLLVLSAGTNNVEQIKQHFDLAKLFEVIPNERIKQNLTAYYSS